MTVRNKFVRRAPTSLKSSVIVFLRRLDLALESAVTELGNLYTRELLELRVAGANWWHSTFKGKVGVVTKTESRVKAAIRIVLTWLDLWHWLVDHGVYRCEIDRKFIKSLLDLYKHKSFRSRE